MPDGAADMVADLYRRMPEARITDILLEVDDATRFTEAFTHLRTGEPCRDRIGLLNVLLAEGVNLGLQKMAEATTTHGFWELMRIARWHVEGDAFDRALAPFATQTIPATVHEAPYILDGLLMNETGRRVREQYADTGGFTDHVFAACSISILDQLRLVPLEAFDAPHVPRVPLRPRTPRTTQPGRLQQRIASRATRSAAPGRGVTVRTPRCPAEAPGGCSPYPTPSAARGSPRTGG